MNPHRARAHRQRPRQRVTRDAIAASLHASLARS